MTKLAELPILNFTTASNSVCCHLFTITEMKTSQNYNFDIWRALLRKAAGVIPVASLNFE